MAVGAPPGPWPGPATRRSSSVMPRGSAAVMAVQPPRRVAQDAGDPAFGRLDLALARQRLGAVPQVGQGRGPGLVGDRPHEPLALLVLVELEVHPDEPHDRPLEAGLALAPLVEPGADALDVGHDVPADLVHDVVGEALEQAHDRLGLAEQPALLVRHEPLDPVVAAALAAERPAQLAERVARHDREVVAERRRAVAPGGRRGTAGARDAPRTRTRGSSRGGRSRSGTRAAARRGRAPCAGCSPRRTAAGPGVASADSRARSYWPSTRWPMNPSRKPSWRVVTQRLARAIDALATPPPGGMTWSSRRPSRWPMRAANEVTLARTQPARSTTPARATMPGSSAPRTSDSLGTMTSSAAV